MRQVTSGVKRDPSDNAQPGRSYGYGFDHIGNRETATRDTRTDTYTSNALNQITTINYAGADQRGQAL